MELRQEFERDILADWDGKPFTSLRNHLGYQRGTTKFHKIMACYMALDATSG